jgi:hypothetical protein
VAAALVTRQEAAAVDDEVDEPPICRSVVPAGSVPPPRTRAPRSVFDLAIAAAANLKQRGRFGAAEGFEVPATARPLPVAVERSAGVVRHIGDRYPSDRWTEAKQARENERRAKQRPPKPTAAAKGKRSRKLRELVGDDLWD